MARIEYDDREVRVVLTAFEKAGAVHGDVTVPRTAVTEVEFTRTPMDEVSGLRFPGTHIPGRMTLGSFPGRSRTFAVAYSKPGVIIHLRGQRFGRLVISVDGAKGLAEELSP